MTGYWEIRAPMRAEAGALRRGLGVNGHRVRHTGVGPRWAARAAHSTARSAAAVAVAGIGAGLQGDLRTGDVIVASEVRIDPRAAAVVPARVECPTAQLLAAALRRRGLTVHIGGIVSSDRLVAGTDRSRLAATGALLADTESAWLLSCRDARPRCCVRVVADVPSPALWRPATLPRVRTALRVLPTVAAALAAWGAATGVRRVLLDSCYATTNRQVALHTLAAESDVVLLLGASNSENSRRLVQVVERTGTRAYFVDDVSGVELRWLAGVRTVGLTADACAPAGLVDDVVRTLAGLGAREITEYPQSTVDIHVALPEQVHTSAKP